MYPENVHASLGCSSPQTHGQVGLDLQFRAVLQSPGVLLESQGPENEKAGVEEATTTPSSSSSTLLKPEQLHFLKIRFACWALSQIHLGGKKRFFFLNKRFGNLAPDGSQIPSKPPEH